MSGVSVRSRVSVSYESSSLALGLGETVVGRDSGCAIRFADLSVSRRHAKLVVEDQDGDLRVTIFDLSSANGTKVNGVLAAEPVRLQSGDHIAFGATSLRVWIDDALDQVLPSETLDHLPSLGARCGVCGCELALGEVECSLCDPTAAGEVTAVFDGRPKRKPQQGSVASEAASDSGRERRRHEREPARLYVVYDSETLSLDAHSDNLSSGGIFVVTELFDQVGTSCSMTIVTERDRQLCVRGVVRHVATTGVYGMGIEFTRVEGELPFEDTVARAG